MEGAAWLSGPDGLDLFLEKLKKPIVLPMSEIMNEQVKASEMTSPVTLSQTELFPISYLRKYSFKIQTSIVDHVAMPENLSSVDYQGTFMCCGKVFPTFSGRGHQFSNSV